MARIQTIVQLTSEMVEALDREARRAGVSRSALIREAVEGYLAASSEEEITVQLVAAYTKVPQGVEDDWGDLSAQVRENTGRTLRRLDAEDEEAGMGW